jgi:hypothetical protein
MAKNPKVAIVARISRSFTFRALMVVSAIAVIAAVALTIKDKIRHEKLDASVSQLRAELQRRGIDGSERSEKCRRQQVKYGPGAKHCFIEIRVQYDDISTEEATETTQAYQSAIESTGKFTRETFTSESHPTGNRFGFARYTEKTSGLNCNATYDFNAAAPWQFRQKQRLYFEFTCFDNSWFTNLTNTGL